jgi:hypothetical protein
MARKSKKGKAKAAACKGGKKGTSKGAECLPKR